MGKKYEFTRDERRLLEISKFIIGAYQLIDGKVVTLLVSDAFCKFAGASREELVNSLNDSMFDNVHPEDAGKLKEMGTAFAHHQIDYDVVYRTKTHYSNDEYHLMHTQGVWQTMRDGSEVAFLYYTDLNNSRDQIKKLDADYFHGKLDEFYNDSLTGLPNLNYYHAFVTEKTAKLLNNNKTPVVVYIDMNRMTAYNAHFGFKAGDELLKKTADFLKTYFPDGMVTRFNDDHFVVVDDYEGVTWRIERVAEAVREASLNKSQGIKAGISSPIETDNGVVGQLEQAMHAEKSIGDDNRLTCVEFTSSMNDRYLKEQYILENFETALENHWIKVFYQGIMNTKDKGFAFFEGLARWIDPIQGMITPGEFIPVLEKYHLIHKLNMYMIEQILQEIPKRRSVGFEILPVSVNLSVEDFDDEDMPKKINELLKRYHAEPWMLIIEITERAFAKTVSCFKDQVDELRANGLKVWVDDFGSGYSSLNVMGNYAFDLIKLDIVFLRELDKNNGFNRTVMKGIVKMFKSLGVQTLSEGVETKENHEFLESIGCDFEQGFYFDKPKSLDQRIYNFRHSRGSNKHGA